MVSKTGLRPTLAVLKILLSTLKRRQKFEVTLLKRGDSTPGECLPLCFTCGAELGTQDRCFPHSGFGHFRDINNHGFRTTCPNVKKLKTHARIRTYADTQKGEEKQKRQVCSIYYRTAATYLKFKDLKPACLRDQESTFASEAMVVMP